MKNGHDFNILIVGGGPAGAAAAYDLAAGGHRVLILERSEFPRVKPCAGGVTVKAIKRLRYSIAPVIRHVARDLHFSDAGRLARTFTGIHPIAVLTVRAQLDAFCLDRAIARGCELDVRKAGRIVAVDDREDKVTVTFTDGDVISADYLIAADGANSTIRRTMNRPPAERAFALEGHLVQSHGGPSGLRLDFNVVAGGYGWIFPKGDHLNVGLYTQKEGVALSKEALRRYAAQTLGASALEAVVGHPIGIGCEKRVANGRRVLFVGDAAGTCERLLGEGIHNAIKSGQAAAAAICAHHGSPRSVQAKFHHDFKEVSDDVRACARAAKLFYSSGALGVAALGLHPAKTAMLRGSAAGLTFRTIVESGIAASFYRIDEVDSIAEYERTVELRKR